MKIAISSGKGGTGKTLVATNIAATLSRQGHNVSYLDCDVEAPNGWLFLKPQIMKEDKVSILSPVGVDENKCIYCGKCAKVCHYHAIAVIKNKVLFFPELCHNCGACEIVCPKDAIIVKDKEIGVLINGKSKDIKVHYGLLKTGVGGMSPRLVRKVKEYAAPDNINILDSPPGTACPVVETVKDMDLTVLVTDSTPFGINDLKLSVNMCRQVGQEPVVLFNRVGFGEDKLKKFCKLEDLEVIGEIADDRKIAEVYSVGELIVDKLPQYKELFSRVAKKMINLAQNKRKVKKMKLSPINIGEEITPSQPLERAAIKKSKDIVIISGKGGTGKTSLAASFAALSKGNSVISDCDVDAADLYLILNPEVEKRGYFTGGVNVEIIQDKCTGCGRCYDVCRFDAIKKDGEKFIIDKIRCEGCGTCSLVCKDSAIKTEDAINGEWFVSKTRFGEMTHAFLWAAEENTGRLVTLIRNMATNCALSKNKKNIIIDGSPGIGCPVIASLTGANYALAITEPTVSGVHDLKRILDLTKHFGIKTGVVVNKYDLNPEISEKIKKVTENYSYDFLGVIPYDRKVVEAQMKGLSIIEYNDGQISKKIKELWKKVTRKVEKDNDHES